MAAGVIGNVLHRRIGVGCRMHFELAQRPDNSRWFWCLVGATGTAILQSASYPTKADAFRDIREIVGTRNVPIYERMPEEEEAPRQLGAERPLEAQGSHTKALVDAAS